MGRAWCSAGLLLAAGLAGTTAAAADPAPLDLSYELTLGGLTVMSFDLDVRTSGQRYVMNFAGRTRGMLSLFGSGDIASSSEGRLRSDGATAPEVFVSRSDGSEGGRRSEIDYGADGPATWTVEPKPGSDGEALTPIPPASIPGTRDILASLYDFSVALAGGQGCRRDMRVFDGRRRFDLEFSDRGPELVEPEGAGFYAGPARHCHLDLVRIGGYPTDRSRFLSGDEAEFWLAPVLAGEPPVPVEIVFRGRFGMMHARLAVARHGAEFHGAPAPSPQSAVIAAPGHDAR